QRRCEAPRRERANSREAAPKQIDAGKGEVLREGKKILLVVPGDDLAARSDEKGGVVVGWLRGGLDQAGSPCDKLHVERREQGGDALLIERFIVQEEAHRVLGPEHDVWLPLARGAEGQPHVDVEILAVELLSP